MRKCFQSEVSSVFTLGYPFIWPQLCPAPSPGLLTVAVAAGGATFPDLWDETDGTLELQ